MKKIFFAVIILCAVLTACRKSTPAMTYPAGSWTLKGTTFPATSCTISSPEVTAYDSLSGTTSCNVTLYFDSILPVASGAYTVVAGALTAQNQVAVLVGYTEPGLLNFYSGTGGNGNQKISVSVNNGKLNITGTGIEVANTNNTADSAALNFNITQTQ